MINVTFFFRRNTFYGRRCKTDCPVEVFRASPRIPRRVATLRCCQSRDVARPPVRWHRYRRAGWLAMAGRSSRPLVESVADRSSRPLVGSVGDGSWQPWVEGHRNTREWPAAVGCSTEARPVENDGTERSARNK